MDDRTIRQRQGIKRWLNADAKATLCYATGVGKTWTAVQAILLLLKHQPDALIKIIVPTEVLRKQWIDDYINKYSLGANCIVEIINSAVMYNSSCDLLVLDEIHGYASDVMSQIFERVTYKMILGLTATIERLDGKEEIIKQYAPVCDTITLEEALENGWISPVKQYLVLLDVDLTEYKKIDQKFNSYFSFFGYDWNVGQKCLTDWKYRNAYAKRMGVTPKDVIKISADWMRQVHARTHFIASHPKKIEVCKKILSARKNKKCITFSSTIEEAEKIGCDFILHSKQKKKLNKNILDQFNSCSCGSIASSKALDVGVDVKGLSVGIIMNVNSSKIKSIQRLGRICRFEPGKTAEMFILIIRGTQEMKWFNNSNTNDVSIINEEQLDRVLAGENIQVRKQEVVTDIKYRF